MDPNEIPGSALNDGAPLHEHTSHPPTEPPAAEEPKKRKAKKDVPDHLKPESLAAYDHDTVKLVNEQDKEIDELHASYTASKEETKERKMAWEAKRDTLQRVIKERKANRGKPVQKTLLDHAAPVAEEPGPADTIAAAPVQVPSALDELWREYPLARLTAYGMTEKDVEILASGERKGGLGTILVRTMGELANYSAGDGGVPRHISDFKGLGASGATRIDAAIENFWGWWNGGGLAEFAAERGIPSAVDPNQPGAGSGTAGAGGEGNEPGELGGDGGGDGEDGEVTVIVEHFLNDPDAPPPSLTDEDLAAFPTGDDSGTFSLGGDGEGE